MRRSCQSPAAIGNEKSMVPTAHVTATIVGSGIDVVFDKPAVVTSTATGVTAAGSKSAIGMAFATRGTWSSTGGASQIPNGKPSRITKAAARIKWRTDARLRRAAATPARASIMMTVALTTTD